MNGARFPLDTDARDDGWREAADEAASFCWD
jgi:hypothetical protein